MKKATFILVTFILYLAFKPGIDLLSLQTTTEQSCCGGFCIQTSENDKSQEQKKDNDCEGKSCNPFQVCSSCVFVCFNLPLISISKYTVFLNEKFTYQSTFSSQFAPDFWQPPKIV